MLMELSIFIMSRSRTTTPIGHEIYNFGSSSLGHHYFILSLSDLCLSVKRTYMTTPSRRNRAIIADPHKFIVKTYAICLKHAQELKMRLLKEMDKLVFNV